mgnify:CR=1 FL=1
MKVHFITEKRFFQDGDLDVEYLETIDSIELFDQNQLDIIHVYVDVRRKESKR